MPIVPRMALVTDVDAVVPTEASKRSILLSATLLALAAAGIVLLLCVVLLPWAEHVASWVIPSDAWVPLRPARYVSDGAMFRLYEVSDGRTGYPYTPALPVVLAWVPGIGDHFHLLGDLIFTQGRPHMFLILGPALGFIGTLPLLYVTGRAVQPASRTRTLAIQLLVFVAASWASISYLHPEDTIACACLIAACIAAGRDNWRAAGALLAVGLLFKQWAAWPAIPIVVAAPRHKRSIVAFYAFGIPALVMAPFLLSTVETWRSLTGALTSLHLGHPQLWLKPLFGGRRYGNTTVLRVLWGATSVAIAIRVRRCAETIACADTLLAAVGTVMLLRLLFEPVMFGYYLVPPVVIAIVWSARNGYPVVMRAIAGFWLGAFSIPHAYPEAVFWLVLTVGLAYICGPMIRSLVRPQGDGAANGDRLNPGDPILATAHR